METVLLGSLLVACVSGIVVVSRELRALRRDTAAQHMLSLFGPALARVEEDPRQLMAWGPVADAARRRFPHAFAELDRTAGGKFPFTDEQIGRAHARCTSDWLAWERTHDSDYKLRVAELEDALQRLPAGADTSVLKARIAALEREKLQRYQQRYEEYVRVSKSIAGMQGKR